jgi:hypothetical protein
VRITPRHERHEQRAADIAKVIAIIETTGERQVDAGDSSSRNLQGDRRVLRMIPVHAYGVGGTVPGTNPLAELLRQERLTTRRRVRHWPER